MVLNVFMESNPLRYGYFLIQNGKKFIFFEIKDKIKGIRPNESFKKQ